jgi:menaquinol-cytochrome c reductase iron-sulfur subunit
VRRITSLSILHNRYNSFATAVTSTATLGVDGGFMSSHTLDFTPDVNRRRLLLGGIYTGVGLICAGLGVPAAPYLLSPPKEQTQTPWINVGGLSDFMPGSPQTVAFRISRTDGWRTGREEASAWVVNQSDGRITAFSPACTHLGCLYRWQETARQFICPCHGSRFAIDGEVLAGPAERPLDRYEVRVEGNQVWVKPQVKPETART